MDKFVNLEEIARVGYTDDGYEVYIVTDDDGNIPHFHYRKGSNGKYEFHTCIKLDSAEYFHHTGKEDILNIEQKKSLQKFLSSTFRITRFQGTNWDFILMLWNTNNLNIEVDEDLKMPNYNNLK